MTLAALIEKLTDRFERLRASNQGDSTHVSYDEWHALREALPVWRPIETIPHNVQHALLTGGTFTWDDNLGACLPLDFVACATFDTLYKEWRDGELSYKPTHWMPLPDALNPKEAE